MELFKKRDGPLFTVDKYKGDTWALYHCNEMGEPVSTPLAWVERSPQGWEISIAEGRRWLPLPETLEMLARNGLLDT